VVDDPDDMFFRKVDLGTEHVQNVAVAFPVRQPAFLCPTRTKLIRNRSQHPTTGTKRRILRDTHPQA
jgi:hypothetical protein